MSETLEIIGTIDASNLEAWNVVRINPSKALQLGEKNLLESQVAGYDKGIAWSYGNMGAAHTWLGNYEKALEHTFKAADLLRNCAEFKQEVQILYNISLIFHFLGDGEKQLHYAFESLELARKIGDQAGEANGLNGVGTVHYGLGKNEEAIEYLTQGSEIAIKVGDKNVLGRIYDGLGQAHFHLKNYEKALEFKNKSLEVVNQLGVKAVQSYAHNGLGEIYTKLEDYSKALEHFKTAMDLRNEMGFRDGVGQTTRNIADTYAAAGDNISALKYYKEALKIGEELTSNELCFKTHLGLSELYEKMGNLPLFVEHFKAYHTHKQQHSSENENKKIKAFELKGKLEQIQKEKERLEEKNELLLSYFEDVKTLSRIGNEITATRDIEGIFNIIYHRINSLMDANGVFIGMCNYEKNKIEVKLAIDSGKRDNYFEYSLDDVDKKLPVLAVKRQLDIHINDYHAEIGKYLSVKEELIREANQSVVVIPLITKDLVIGVLLVQSVKKSAFSKHNFNILKSFAGYIAIAIDNARLYESMEDKVQERTLALEKSYKNTETLNRIGQELISSLNFEDVFERLYRNVNELMDATVFGVRLHNPEENTVEYTYEYERGERLSHITVSMDNNDNYSVWCIKNNKEILINNNEVDYVNYVSKVMVVGGDFPYSLIFYPLRKGEKVLGAISVQSFEKNVYTDYHVNIVKTLAHYTVIALENAKNYEVMEEEVKLRTSELIKQKEEVQRSYENTKLLSEIGKEIAAELSIPDILSKVYNNVNALMDASVFGIGIYKQAENQLYFSGTMEKGEKLRDFWYVLTEDKIAAHCFNSGNEIVINDWASELEQYVAKDYTATEGDMPESMIYLPLVSKGNKIGVLTVQSFAKSSYNEYHLNILRTLSVYVASAIENASLYRGMEDRVEERTKELVKSHDDSKLLNQIGQELISTLNFNTAFETLYSYVKNMMDAAVFGVRLYDEEKDGIQYNYDFERGVRMGHFFVPMSNINNYSVLCVKNNEEIIINDHRVEYKKYVSEINIVDGDLTNSIIMYPLRKGDKVLGVISLQSFEKYAYSDYHINIVRTLAHYTVIALENSRHFETMEAEVKIRTKEVVQQKEEIEKTYENTKLLSEIGKDITSQITVEKIIEVVYLQINRLMDAEGFGIGIHDQATNQLNFPGYIESAKKLSDGGYHLEDEKDRLGCVCFNNDLEFLVNDLETEYVKYTTRYLKPVRGKSSLSLIYIPIKSKNKKIGVITVQSFEKNAYTDYHFNIMRTIGVYVGIALDNAGLYHNMEERVNDRTRELVKSHEDAKLLNQIGQELISTLSFTGAMETLYKYVKNLMDSSVFSIRLLDVEKNEIDYVYSVEHGKILDAGRVSMNNDNNYSVVCIKKNMEILIRDNQAEYKNYVKELHVVAGDEPVSMIFYPLRKGDKVLGVISLQSFKKNAYHDYHINIVRTLAHYTVIALENSRNYETMEAEVKVRTQEVVKQKEEIEKTYENTKLLSEIGKDITSQLSVEKIIEVVYERINKLMDAEGFGIGIYDEIGNQIVYPGYIESGEKLEESGDSLANENKLASYSFNKNEEIIVGDLKNDYKKYIKKYVDPEVGEHVTSLIYIPLRSKDKKIGVITVQSFKTNAYSDYHANILRTIAVYTAIALDNAGLYQNMEDRVVERTIEIDKAYQNTKLIGQISKDIAESLSIDTIISRVYNNVNTLMDATCFGIGIFNPKTEMIQMPGFIENGERVEEFGYHINDDRLATWCFNNQKEIFISEYAVDYIHYLKQIKKAISGKDSTSIIYLPLYLKDKIVGLITVQSYEKNAYTEYHMDILRGLATTIAAAIENAKLYEDLEDKVRERTAEVVKQKEIIEEKNKNITDSIIYAKRIQDATLPDKSLVRNYLEESFVLFKPKDIVSGDFYWIHKVEDTILFAVVDCTGHGVPGAFLSLIGHNSLNQIVNEHKIYKPSEILQALNRIVSKTLQNNLQATNIKDGMDMSICSLNLTTNVLQFAGAFNPLYLVRDNNIEEIKGDKIAIGSTPSAYTEFTNNVIQLKEGDCIYLFSDGYADQFGGPKGKKFKYSRFKELLIDINKKDMSEQHDILNSMIDEWQGDLEQIDDVCVIGFRS